jgi:hypothetical protein
MKNLYPRNVSAIAAMLTLTQANALDIRGIHIGDAWNSDWLQQAFSYPTVPATQRVKCTDGAEETCVGRTRYLSIDVGLTIEGKNGRVRKITITLPVEQFDGGIRALKHEFGEPTDEWSSLPGSTAPILFHHRVDWRLRNEELFGLQFSTMAIISLTTPEESIAGRYLPPT